MALIYRAHFAFAKTPRISSKGINTSAVFGFANTILEVINKEKPDYLGVAFADEGITLKNAGINLPIMVLNPESTSFTAIIQHQLEPEIYSLPILKSFVAHENTHYDY